MQYVNKNDIICIRDRELKKRGVAKNWALHSAFTFPVQLFLCLNSRFMFILSIFSNKKQSLEWTLVKYWTNSVICGKPELIRIRTRTELYKFFQTSGRRFLSWQKRCDVYKADQTIHVYCREYIMTLQDFSWKWVITIHWAYKIDYSNWGTR